jgi:hypothetical protein
MEGAMNRVMTRALLGAAAGIALVSGAQAADMPVKAKAVEYVKVCSAYGAGFYYIPGTDICLRVGGYVFLETGVKGRNAAVDVIYDGADGFNSDDNYMQWRARGHVILDARQNTAYGTLRAYFVGGVSYSNSSHLTGTPPADTGVQSPAATNTGASLDRAFIEFAGFTAGFTESFFSFGGAYSIVASPSLSWDWLPLLAYTAQLGNGVTATVSFEDGGARRSGMAPFNQGFDAQYGGTNMPDIIGNVRVTQAWGSAQIMAALHELKTNVDSIPDSSWGHAIGAGVEVKTPQTGNPNNSFLLQGVYSKGAVEFTGLAASPVTTVSTLGFVLGSSGAVTPIFDALGFGSDLFKTKAWSVYAGYRHYWTPTLRTGFAAGMTKIDYAQLLNEDFGIPDARVWQGTMSTIWSPVAGLDLSLDLVYSNVKTNGCPDAGEVCGNSEGIWTAWTRIRRNF